MIIKSLELTNFRQFVGTQKLEFSTDSSRKATIVIAENTTGKTTLLESFSWVFYGTTNLKSIINAKLVNQLNPYESLMVSGSVELEHMGLSYKINRTQRIHKAQVNVTKDESILTIENSIDGISKQVKGKEANIIINEIVPKDLFSYFFFKGESIEKIGKEISKGKSGNNGEFVNAIRGMMGFNWLYTAKDHLVKVAKDYREELQRNSKDLKLSSIVQRLNDSEQKRIKFKDRLDIIKEEIEYFENERDNIHQEIVSSGDVSEKQNKSRRLEDLCKNKLNEIYDQQRKMFSNFSNRGYEFIAIKAISDAFDTLQDADTIDKGIPGMQAEAVEYLINQRHQCICDTPIEKDSMLYEKLVELMKYLPPNNIGYEIRNFKSKSEDYMKHGINYYDDYFNDRKRLNEDINFYQSKVKELEQINNEIKNYPNMEVKKNREKDLIEKVNNLYEEQGQLKSNLEQANNEYDSVLKEKEAYQITDEQNRRIASYEKYCNYLIDKIDNFCQNEEKVKKEELQQAINSIFKEIFHVDINISLSENYDISIESSDVENLEDFENSTSQDGIMAFSFIGGIIQLARNKIRNKNQDDIDNDIEEELTTEPYPLVMDAPSSSFDIARIKNFCRIMPNIAEQVIIFIKDTDGLHVKENLLNVIGKEYQLIKNDKYTTRIVKEGEING